MKVSNRIISMLLALVMVVSLLPAVTPIVAEAAAADTPAGVRNHLPDTAVDKVYLSDMDWEYSINYQNKEAIRNGAWSNGGKIVMGLAQNNGGTVFEKGLGVMPKGTSATDASHTIFDLADNDYKQNFFYAAAGITNGTAQGGTISNGLVFEVWGSYDKSVEDYTQAEYTLLERSGDPEKGTHVKGSYVYQFHLDVTGVRYLKLVVYAVGGVGYMNCNWAGACVYNNSGYYPKSDLMGLNNGKDNTTYVPSGTDRFNTYHFENLPSDAVLLTGSTYKDPSTYKGTSKVVDFKSASGNLGSGKHWLGGIADTLDPTKTTANQKDGILLTDASKYLRFNARTPANSGNQTDGWVTFDISDLDVNRFYTVIGGGNGTAKHTAYNPSNGIYGGMVCQVLGAETVNGEYKPLAESEPILLSQTGEFLVDITGVNYLKLRIQAKDYRLINGLDVLFYMPCVFNEWDIAASGATAVMQGTQADYTAAIRHDFTADYPYSGTVTWTVSGGTMAGTKIENGKLSVDPMETATSLQITASITEGGKTYTSAPVAVEVTKAPVYTLEIQGPEEAGKNTEQTVSAAVTVDGTPTSYDNITWTVAGNTDPATKVENGKLMIGNEPVGTTLKITASFTEYGTTYKKEITVTIAAYGISIKGSTDMFPGTQITLESEITNDGQPIDGTVTWSVEGNGTITPNGKRVVVTAGGAIGTIKVTASWTTPAGNPCTATHEIAVNAYTIDVSSPATAVSKDGTLPLTATVKKNGVAVENPSVSWTVVNLTNGDVTNKTGAALEWIANEDVDTILVFTATAQFGSQTISDTFVVKVTDYKLAIDQTDVQVEQGETAVLKATLTKGDAPAAAPMLNWSVSKVGGSTLNTIGDQLQLTANDPVDTELTVIVSCVVDGETLISAPAKVTVIPVVVYAVSLDKTSASIKPGESVDFTVTVTKDGTAVTDPILTWTVTGATTAETVIDESGKLTIGALEPTGTVLNVTATYDANGKLITSQAAVVTVASAAAQSSFTAVTGDYASLPSNSIYLADEGVVWIESVNLGGKTAIKNGAWDKGGAIWIGGGSTTGGTKFDKGIGMQPQAPTATNDRGASWTTIDISTYDCDTFYAAVGSTNASNQQNGHNSFVYQVYGATMQDGPFTLLAESTPLTKTSTGEFKVDITGMKYLKLVIKCTETGNHGYGNSVWANACVYDSTAELYKITVTEPIETIEQGKEVTFTAQITKEDQPVTDQTITWTVTGGTKPGTAISAEGKLTVDKDEPASTKLTVTASITVGEDVYTSEAMVITVTEVISEHFQENAYKANTSGKYATMADNVIYLSDVDWVESINLGNKAAIKNGAWDKGAAIWIGGGANSGGTQFKKGIGVQAQSPTADNNRGASWTTINVSKMNCDTFYAAIGGTNASNQLNGHNSFIYQVYGTYGDSSEFVLLAQSEPITKTQTGEITVNIKGVKLLKLVIKCTDTGGHGYGNSVWANACVYNKDGTPGNHPNPPIKPVTETPKQTDAFSKIEDGIYLTPTGKVNFLSDMDWIESVNLGGAEAIRNGAWANGAAIWIGGTSAENGGKKFVKGIGVQPQSPNADNNRGASWTLIDISELGCDTFFAVIGGTNASNQQNGHNSFIYQVYGGDSKDGKFTLLAQSEPITKTMTGEFKVDITGVKFLKLVIKCDETGNHGYGNSVWANACVFNSEEAELVEDNGEVETGPSAPTTTKPKPSAPAKTDDVKDDGDAGLSKDIILYIAIGAGAVLLAILAAVVVIIKKKKVK